MFLNRGMIEAAKAEGEVLASWRTRSRMSRCGTALLRRPRGRSFRSAPCPARSRRHCRRRCGRVISQGSQFGLGAAFPEVRPRVRAAGGHLGAQIWRELGTTRARWRTCSRRSRTKAAAAARVAERPPESGQPLQRDQSEASNAAGSGQSEHRPVPDDRARLRGMSPAYTAEQIAKGQARATRDRQDVQSDVRVNRAPSSQYPGVVALLVPPCESSVELVRSGRRRYRHQVPLRKEGTALVSGKLEGVTHGFQIGWLHRAAAAIFSRIPINSSRHSRRATRFWAAGGLCS